MCQEPECFERIPENFKITYRIICLVEKNRGIILFVKTHYKVSIHVGIVANKMTPVYSVLDTDAGAKFIQEYLLVAEWHRAIRAYN